MKTKLFYQSGIPKPIALVMLGAVMFAFCCTDCLLAQEPSNKNRGWIGPIYYCGCIEMVTCYGDAPELPKALIRPLDLPVSMSDITANLMYPIHHEQFDRALYAQLFRSKPAVKFREGPDEKKEPLMAQREKMKATGNK